MMNIFRKFFLFLFTFIPYVVPAMEEQPKSKLKSPPSLKFQTAYLILQQLEKCKQKEYEDNRAVLAQLPDEFKEYINGLEMLHLCLKSINISIKKNPTMALWVAIELEATQFFDDLVTLGADLHYEDKRCGATPLMLATRKNKVTSIDKLIELGAIIHSKNELWGQTALHPAVYFNNLPLVEALVNYKADINAKDKDGCIPLHYLSVASSEMLNFLIDKGADINAQTRDGYTPLMGAIDNNTISLVKLFLDKGARLDLTNAAGKTALDLAQENNFDEIVKVLQQHQQ